MDNEESHGRNMDLFGFIISSEKKFFEYTIIHDVLKTHPDEWSNYFFESPSGIINAEFTEPPSTNKQTPLIKLAASDAKYATALAQSNGSPIRPTG
ncbi:hypothetical protein DERF_006200 [Dermatophagoides farinae]|uniref:Uncharacterized protein n=1 Tax=Dermatophagoides farinae TaxID=6954 RepID=A0A922IB52_DERFA|nr:hypothetical protein DERF_006200 [Dermatophagoides farinae]